MKIVTVLGARPQFIKASVVSKSILRHSEIEEVIVHTGQHFDNNMSDIFFKELGIPLPKYQLSINTLSHGAMVGRMMEQIEEVLLKEKPQYVMVYGDTNSTLAGALAAKKINIKLIHIEAGLRSFDMSMPEELNRVLTDRVSDWLFCPTQTAVENLYQEGYSSFPCKIKYSGDVMFDATRYAEELIEHHSFQTSLPNKDFCLCTFHRAENTDQPDKLSEIIDSLNTINQSLQVLVLLHPRTKLAMQKLNIKPQFQCIDPVGYLDMIRLLKHCQYIITDSGGLQKEAYFLNKCSIILRNTTEWVELVSGGCSILSGVNKIEILKAVEKMNTNNSTFLEGIFGDGNAAELIVRQLSEDIMN